MKGRHALVTGGGRGIGLAVAQMLAAHGATVSLIGRTMSTLEEARDGAALGGGIADCRRHRRGLRERCRRHALSRPRRLRRSGQQCRRRGKRALQGDRPGALEPHDRGQPDRHLQRHPCRAQGACLDAPAGRIINIASTAALKGYAYVTAYSAAKHGVLGSDPVACARTRAHGRHGQRDLSGLHRDRPAGGLDREDHRGLVPERGGCPAQLVSVNPQGRFIEPREVAETALWLCSDAARSVTGQAITLAGGEVM